MASSSARATSDVDERLRPARLPGELGDETFRHVAEASRARPDGVSRPGTRGAASAPRLREHVDRLVALEHADEERGRPRRERRRLALDEGLEIT